LDRLISGQRTQGRNVLLGLKQMPQAFGSGFCKRIFQFKGSPQFKDIIRGVSALDAGPAGVVIPLALDAFSVVFQDLVT